MTEKGGALHTLALIGGLAAFVGIGALAVAIGLTWTPANTQALISAGAAVCGGGFALFSGIVGAGLALSFYRRATAPRDETIPAQWRELPAARWEDAPPALPDGNAGSWQTPGPAAYDLAPRGGATFGRDA